MAFDYDMIVIGAGAAGLTAAGMSAVLGAKTALVEEHRLGGDCTWTGCIPSKTLIRGAKVVHEARTADRFGLHSFDASVDFTGLMDHVRSVRQHIYEDADAPPNMEKLGVEVVRARARFLDPHAIELSGTDGQVSRLTSRYFIVATGSRPRRPDFEAPVLTNESIFELEKQPQHLLVLGAGPIGIEMAQAFRRLGSQVSVVSPGARILPKDDPELTGELQQVLSAEGITLCLGHKVVAATKRADGVAATLEDGTVLRADAILAAIGRQPNVEGLGLEAAGVNVTERGIEVDKHCRTSQKHIYATGDVTGGYQFTHMAEHMSKVAVTRAILHLPASVDEARVSWCTFTDPELARVGSSEEQLKSAGANYDVYRFPFTKLDRAITEGATSGVVKILAASSGRILGASILGANAGEMIGEWAVAMKGGLKLKTIADTIHPYPTYILGNRRAADHWYTRQLGSPLLGLVGKIFRYRGERKTNVEI